MMTTLSEMMLSKMIPTPNSTKGDLDNTSQGLTRPQRTMIRGEEILMKTTKTIPQTYRIEMLPNILGKMYEDS